MLNLSADINALIVEVTILILREKKTVLNFGYAISAMVGLLEGSTEYYQFKIIIVM